MVKVRTDPTYTKVRSSFSDDVARDNARETTSSSMGFLAKPKKPTSLSERMNRRTIDSAYIASINTTEKLPSIKHDAVLSTPLRSRHTYSQSQITNISETILDAPPLQRRLSFGGGSGERRSIPRGPGIS